MEIYYAVCAGLATLSLLMLIGTAVVVLFEVRKAVIKVERLTDHVDERVESVRGLLSVVDRVTWSMTSGWARGIDLALGVLSAFRERRAENGGRPHGRGKTEEAEEREKTS